MNRADYITTLQDRLKGLPEQEVEEAIRYVEEYFDEAGEENFQKAMDELGSPYRFANQVKADVVSKKEYSPSYAGEGKSRYQKSNSSNLWVIILGILSLPISLPILITIAALIFSSFAVLASLVIAGAAVLVAGIVVLFRGFFYLATLPFVGLSVIAVSVLGIGLSLILIYFFVWLIQKTLPGAVNWLGNLFQKIKERVS